MSLWRGARARLFVSHAVAGIVGVAVGFAYTTKMSTSTQAVLQGFQRRPLLDAANVAVRFGSPEHARATLESLCRHLRGSDCPPEELRALAANLARQRQ